MQMYSSQKQAIYSTSASYRAMFERCFLINFHYREQTDWQVEMPVGGVCVMISACIRSDFYYVSVSRFKVDWN